MSSSERISFELPSDGSGYPPDSHERLWALPLRNGNYLVDNIPFYVVGISSGDEIEAGELAGELFFRRLVRPSGNSTFRLLLSDPSRSPIVRNDLAALGCESEFNQIVGVLAVEIPGSVSIAPFLKYISDAKQAGDVDVEEGALRHQTT